MVAEVEGTVGVGPVCYPPRGRAALVADREGAVFGVWEGGVLAEWSIGGERSPAWLELRTADAFDAALFYGAVLEWGQGDGDRYSDTSYEEDQVVLRRRRRPVAKLNSGPVEEATPRPQLRPRWLVHFKVPDLDRATALALENGGTTATGPEWGGGGQVTLQDPDGGLFTLDQVSPSPNGNA